MHMQEYLHRYINALVYCYAITWHSADTSVHLIPITINSGGPSTPENMDGPHPLHGGYCHYLYQSPSKGH